jgi:hypothetical protein
VSSPWSINPFGENRLNSPLDFQPEWDVPSLNAATSGWLEKAIRGLRGRDQPDPGLPIPVLLGPAGYGKTHLFGRVAAHLGQEVLLIFVPQIENVLRPLDHIRWHTIESLFTARAGDPSPLSLALARLCQPSLVAYFASLRPSQAARHQPLQRRMEEDPCAVLSVVQAVKELAPFLKLADSATALFPQLPHDIVRALMLGWSPASLSARHWLRGESLPEIEQERLRLGEEPPQAAQVLRAIATLFRFQVPVVLCCDQLEAVLIEEDAPIRLTTDLITLLHSVPNLLIVLSCLEDKWPLLLKQAHQAFVDRVKDFRPDTLHSDQAVDLVRRRLKHWPGARPEQGGCWPFEESSIAQLADEIRLGPRGLIKLCENAFERWTEDGQPTPIKLKRDGGDGRDLDVLFLREWNRELAVISADPARSPEEVSEDRLFRALKETLHLGRAADWEFGGTRLKGAHEGGIKHSKNQQRPALTLELQDAVGGFAVLVALTKLDNSGQFRHYYAALQQGVGERVHGAVLVHPKSDLRMGAQTQHAFDQLKQIGKLRTFSLTEHRATCERMECLLGFLDKAAAEELQIGGQSLSLDDCRDLILKTGVLENLNLFAALLAGWRVPPAANAVPPVESEAAALASKAAASKAQAVATRQATATLSRTQTESAPQASEQVDNLEAWAFERLQELIEKLGLWSLRVEGDGVEVGPTFARLRVRPLGKTTVSRIRNKSEDLKIHLGLQVWPLIGSQAGFISIDIQLPRRRAVLLEEVLGQPPAGKAGEPMLPVGQDVAGQTHWLNLADPGECHLLVAGTTGSGKSEFLKALIAALARRLGPDQLQFVLIDPKQVTFNFGGGESPYFHRPVAHTLEDALPLVEWCFAETERRYALLRGHRLENVTELNGRDTLPRIVLVLDEFADLMADRDSKKRLETPLKRLGALARAAGIHLVLATQRPEASVVTPLLRSNLPGRISLRVASEADSKIILQSPEAAYLLGRGDLLWKQGGGTLRLQSPLVTRDDLMATLRLV